MYLLNGESKHLIDISDRGFQYGDGLFETIEVYRGKPLFLNKHLARLSEGCERLLIPAPDLHILEQEATELASGTQHAVLKIIVTRGPGGRGYRQPEKISPTRLLTLHPYPSYPENLTSDGIITRFCHHRLGLNPALAGIKHLNRLEQIMARAEWFDDKIHEGIMLNYQGNVVEGTMTNVFYVKDKILVTSPVDQCGIAGIAREIILNLAKQLSITVNQTYFLPEVLVRADEIFVSNSVIGIWPVRQLEQHIFNIGPVTRELQRAYNQLRQVEAS